MSGACSVHPPELAIVGCRICAASYGREPDVRLGCRCEACDRYVPCEQPACPRCGARFDSLCPHGRHRSGAWAGVRVWRASWGPACCAWSRICHGTPREVTHTRVLSGPHMRRPSLPKVITRPLAVDGAGACENHPAEGCRAP